MLVFALCDPRHRHTFTETTTKKKKKRWINVNIFSMRHSARDQIHVKACLSWSYFSRTYNTAQGPPGVCSSAGTHKQKQMLIGTALCVNSSHTPTGTDQDPPDNTVTQHLTKLILSLPARIFCFHMPMYNLNVFRTVTLAL